MITFVSWPKPFSGRMATVQRNAIESWTRLDPRVQVVLLGDEEGVSHTAAALDLDHISTVARNEYGTVLLDDAIVQAECIATSELICYANADVILLPDFIEAVARATEIARRAVVVGRSWGLRVESPLTFGPGWDASLRQRIARGACLREPGAMEYLVFPRGLYGDVPPFALGRAGVDNWLVWRARSLDAAVVDATLVATSIHQDHDYAHVAGGRTWSYEGDEALRNIELAGGWVHLYNVDDATHRLTPNGMRRNLTAPIRSIDPLRRLILAAGRLRRRLRAAGGGKVTPWSLLLRAVVAARWRTGSLLRSRRIWLPGGPLAGCRLRVPPGTEVLYVNREYEPAVAEALTRLVRPGFSCLDLGAHIGYFSLLLARLSGETGRVYAFEPAPANVRYLRANVRLNALGSRVVVEVAAAADRTGQIELYPGRVGSSFEWTVDETFAGREDPAPTARTPRVVRAVALDDYFPEGADIDLVKMDIEGGEGPALQGMRRVLAEAAPIVVLEFHREVGWPAIEQLLAAGYSLERLNGGPIHAGCAADIPYQLIARPASRSKANQD